MTPTIGRVKKFLPVAVVLGALVYAVWRLWQQNQEAAATWAASTDRVE
jgi:predicted negative regulator of RcsB-dependent stress response